LANWRSVPTKVIEISQPMFFFRATQASHDVRFCAAVGA
jgi:hypothetical protein